MSIHLLSSNRFDWSGRNCRNQVCRKGRETAEGSQNSHFQLQPDVQSQERRRHRKGEPQFSSWGRRWSRLVSHKPGKKGSSSTGWKAAFGRLDQTVPDGTALFLPIPGSKLPGYPRHVPPGQSTLAYSSALERIAQIVRDAGRNHRRGKTRIRSRRSRSFSACPTKRQGA
jgi:hypothetical protein